MGETCTADSIKEKVHFAIITIRQDEFEAVLKRFPKQTEVEGKQALYAYSECTTVSGANCGIAVARCSHPGQAEAQSLTTAIIQDLDPDWLLLVGIAGAVPSPEFTLGDVCLASYFHNFSVRAVSEGERDEF